MPPKQLELKTIKRAAVCITVAFMAIVPLAVFGLLVLLGLLFRAISLAFY